MTPSKPNDRRDLRRSEANESDQRWNIKRIPDLPLKIDLVRLPNWDRGYLIGHKGYLIGEYSPATHHWGQPF